MFEKADELLSVVPLLLLASLCTFPTKALAKSDVTVEKLSILSLGRAASYSRSTMIKIYNANHAYYIIRQTEGVASQTPQESIYEHKSNTPVCVKKKNTQ